MSASDRDVVRDVLRGDRNAFAHLVDRYQRRLFGLVLMMVREPSCVSRVMPPSVVGFPLTFVTDSAWP